MATLLATIGGIFYFYIYIYLFNDMLLKSGNHRLSIYTINFICLVASCYLVKYFAKVSDQKGRTTVFVISFTGFLTLSTPLPHLLNSDALGLKLLAYAGLITLFSAFTANAAAVYGEVFPTNIRYSGLATSYNAGIALSSFTPAIASWIQKHHHSTTWNTAMVLTASMLGLVLTKPIQKKIHLTKQRSE